MMKKKLLLLCVCLLMLSVTILPSALCEAPEGRPQGGGFMMRSQMGRYNVDRANLTDEQKSMYDQALTDYAATEDKCLNELVAAGDITQEAVDAFITMRQTQGAMASLDMASWDQAQQQAFQAAMTAEGDERTSAFDALVSSGQLTEAQADAFGNMQGSVNRRIERPEGEAPEGAQEGNRRIRNAEAGDGDMNRRSTNSDIWTQIMGMDQTDAIQAALTEIQAAQGAFSETLNGAGIQMAN